MKKNKKSKKEIEIDMHNLRRLTVSLSIKFAIYLVTTFIVVYLACLAVTITNQSIDNAFFNSLVYPVCCWLADRRAAWIEYVILVGILVWWIGFGYCEYKLRSKLWDNIVDYVQDSDDTYNEEHTYNELVIQGSTAYVHTHESHRNFTAVVYVIAAILSPIIFPIDALATIIYCSTKYGVYKKKLKNQK